MSTNIRDLAHLVEGGADPGEIARAAREALSYDIVEVYRDDIDAGVDIVDRNATNHFISMSGDIAVGAMKCRDMNDCAAFLQEVLSSLGWSVRLTVSVMHHLIANLILSEVGSVEEAVERLTDIVPAAIQHANSPSGRLYAAVTYKFPAGKEVTSEEQKGEGQGNES